MSEQPSQTRDTPSQEFDNNTNSHSDIGTDYPYINYEFNLLTGINITTHNIRGLSSIDKARNWIEHCAENNMHIISLTETKLKESSILILTNPLYFFYVSYHTPTNPAQREASLGTEIMVCRPLQQYIHNIQTWPGT